MKVRQFTQKHSSPLHHALHMSLSGPVVEVDVIVFDHEGKVLLTRRSQNDQWVTAGGVLRDHEFVGASATRLGMELLGIHLSPHCVLGCYHEPSPHRGEQPSKIKFVVTSTISPEMVAQVNLRGAEGQDAEAHWWEPATLLAASSVSPSVKNYFSPTPWNKIL